MVPSLPSHFIYFYEGEIKMITKEQFLEKCEKLFPEYDFSNIDWKSYTTPIIVTCKKHGNFEIPPRKLYQQRGRCPKCHSELLSKISSENAKQRLSKAKQTCLQKYGTENPFQAEEVKEVIKNKAKQTKLNKPKKVYASIISEEKKKFEAENNCTERNTLIAKYGYGWYQAKIIKPIYATINGVHISFYKNDDIQKIEEYYNK